MVCWSGSGAALVARLGKHAGATRPPRPMSLRRRSEASSSAIDSEARARAVKLIESFFTNGTIDNWQFDDWFPRSPDPALEAIGRSLWCLYSDFPKGARPALSDSERALLD